MKPGKEGGHTWKGGRWPGRWRRFFWKGLRTPGLWTRVDLNTWELVILLFRIFLIGDFLHFSCVCSPWLVLNIFAHHGWSGRVVLSSKLFQMAFGKTSRSRASALKKEMFNNLSVESGTIIF